MRVSRAVASELPYRTGTDSAMGTAARAAAAIAVGTAVGSVSSITNAASAPAGALAERVESAGWIWHDAAGVASVVVNAGFFWAACAVLAGWLVGRSGIGAVAGFAALAAATTAYYGMDSLLRDEPFSWYWPEVRAWWLASVGVGPALGVVGSRIARPGALGLLAALAIPVGAIVEMAWLPRYPEIAGIDDRPEIALARIIVWVAAGAVVVLVLVRHQRERRS